MPRPIRIEYDNAYYHVMSRGSRRECIFHAEAYYHLKHTDGPLFRGRYQAILVNKDSYLLPLSRYIHRNPIETKPPLVKSLDTYRWSSYPTLSITRKHLLGYSVSLSMKCSGLIRSTTGIGRMWRQA
jgi:hypothetical protein